MTILFRYKIGNLQIFLFAVIIMETRNRNKKTSSPLVLEPVNSNAPKVKNKRGRPAKADDDKQAKEPSAPPTKKSKILEAKQVTLEDLTKKVSYLEGSLIHYQQETTLKVYKIDF